MTTEKKTRTPRDADSILKGALSLTLQERVDLKKALDKSIFDEVAAKKADADAAAKIADSL